MTVAGSRVYARMAIDGELPRLFRAQAGVPRLAIAMRCTLALALMWSASFKSLLTYIGFTLNLCAAATVVGLIRIRLREGGSTQGCRLAPGAGDLPARGPVDGLERRRPAADREPLGSGHPRHGLASLAPWPGAAARVARTSSTRTDPDPSLSRDPAAFEGADALSCR
jgi:hypothetical protein